MEEAGAVALLAASIARKIGQRNGVLRCLPTALRQMAHVLFKQHVIGLTATLILLGSRAQCVRKHG